MQILKLKEQIEKNLKSVYGEELKFGILKIKEDQLIIVTPFIDNENNLIEIGVFLREPQKIVINDLGKIYSYLEQLDSLGKVIIINPSIFGLFIDSATNVDNKYKNQNLSFNDLKKLNYFSDGFFEIYTDSENIGSDIKRLLLLLQKIYSLELNQDEFGNFNINSFDACNEDFESEFIKVLKDLNIDFIKDVEITGASGDIKNFNFVIKGKRRKYINIISNSSISDINDLIKISFADFYDIKSFKNSFCLVFDDKKYPAIWQEIKKANILNLLKKNNIKYFGFFQEFHSLKSYLLS